MKARPFKILCYDFLFCLRDALDLKEGNSPTALSMLQYRIADLESSEKAYIKREKIHFDFAVEQEKRISALETERNTLLNEIDQLNIRVQGDGERQRATKN